MDIHPGPVHVNNTDMLDSLPPSASWLYAQVPSEGEMFF